MPLLPSSVAAALPRAKRAAAAAAAAAAAKAEKSAGGGSGGGGATTTTAPTRGSTASSPSPPTTLTASSRVGEAKADPATPTPTPTTLLDTATGLAAFDLGPILGTGSFGRVRLARHKASGAPVALKALSKAHLVRHGQVAHLRSERDVLLSLEGPAYVRLLGVFQDPQCIYFALEYVPGGEFFRHLRTRGRLPEPAAQFYAAEVVAALAALHARGVVYRDLKPENLLLDAGGHLKVADFGFAKALPRGGRTYTLCGTPDYLAPEVILNKGHGPSADWWAAGVLIYEMLAGAPPFVEADVGATYRRAVEGRFAVPPHFSASARDLVRRLLQVDLSQRLGCLAGGVGDIKSHPWFRGVDWAAVAARSPAAGPPPIRPPVRHPADTANFDDYTGLAPQEHAFVLSRAEQALFADF